MINQFYALLNDRMSGVRKDKGATAVEYGLLVGLIAVVIIVAVGALGTQLQGMFDGVADALPTVDPSNLPSTTP